MQAFGYEPIGDGVPLLASPLRKHQDQLCWLVSTPPYFFLTSYPDIRGQKVTRGLAFTVNSLVLENQYETVVHL